MGKSTGSAKDRRRARKSLSAWDRFWLWVKVNEKLMWVILLLLIAPAFAFTGPASSLFDGLAGETVEMRIYGEDISSSDIERARNIVRTMNGFIGEVYRAKLLAGILDRAGEEPVTDGVDLLLLEREADRLGIVVSDEDLGVKIREFHHAIKVAQEAFSAASSDLQASRELYATRWTELQTQNFWDHAEWTATLSRLERRSGLYHPKVFEDALRRYVKAQKVIRYVKDSVQATEEEVYDEFRRKEQFRKLTFFQVEPDEEAEKKAAEGLADVELEDYFRENQESFRTMSPMARVDYLYVPYEHFEEGIEPTEEEIEEEYRSLRPLRFRRGLVTDTVEGIPTPEKEEELAEKLYKPLEEVRDEVVEEVVKKKSQELARSFADDLRKKVFPETTGEADAPPAASLDDLASEHDFLETGRTPFMTQWEAKDEMGKYYAVQLATVFTNLARNAREEDPSKHVPVVLARGTFPTDDESGLVLYANLGTRVPGVDPELEDVRDEIREKLVTARALDLAEEKVDAAVEAIRAGEKPFEAAAEGFGVEAHTTAYLKRTDSIFLPVARDEGPDEEAKDDEADDSEGDQASDAPRTERLAGSRTLLEEAFLIAEEGAAGVAAVRDEVNGAYYVVRLDGSLDPDPRDYPKARSRYFDRLLAERRDFYFFEWRKQLFERAGVQRITSGPVPTGGV